MRSRIMSIGVLTLCIAFASASGQDKPELKKSESQKEKKDKLDKAVKEMKELFDEVALENRGIPIRICDATFKSIVTYGDPAKGYDAVGAKTRPTDNGPAIRQRGIATGTGNDVMNTDGFTAFLGTSGGAEILMVPAGGRGFGMKDRYMIVVCIPFEEGKMGKPMLVDPKESDLYKGFQEYHHGLTDKASFMLVMPQQKALPKAALPNKEQPKKK